ncbi:MAG: hypothetical protein DHS20C02_12030 [Micavibrio sp.]|nr:MAG: hypothetical protein DHS20C02_12030 [Micavibrio sp.]
MTTDPAVTDDTDELSYFLSITERDIDLLVLEELHVNQDFTSWFVRSCLPDARQIEFCGAWHSLVDSVHGESDLTLVVEIEGCKTAILIEDKIGAITMPEQSSRYRRRGDKGIADGRWKQFFTCMIAPQRYLDRLSEGEVYDAHISYEDIAEWLKSADNTALNSARGEYRANFVTSAIDKQRRTGASPRDPMVELFLSRYQDHVRQEHPALPAAMINWNWITFILPPIPGSNIGRSLHHKLTQGLIELEFQCTPDQHSDLMRQYSKLRTGTRTFKKYSKYLGLREEVGRLDISNEFDDTKEDVEAALAAAEIIITECYQIKEGSE